MNRFPLIKPFMNDAIKERVISVLDSGYLTEGPITKELEKAFSSYTGVKYSYAFTSCTTGLETALRALDLDPDDEVIIPDYTYPATASVIGIAGAKAVVVDISKDTMLIDYQQLEECITDNTKVLMPVSIFGNPLDYDKLNKLKSKYSLAIIEDAACSIGATYGNEKVGNLADISVFSMHPRKFITTGEGGMLTTNNEGWARWINQYKHFGIDKDETGEFLESGTNYKLSDLLAAIGLEQFKLIDSLLYNRRQIATNYTKLLEGINGVSLPEVTEKGVHAYQSYIIYVDNRDLVMTSMRDKGIEVQIGTYSLHGLKAFKNQSWISFYGDMQASTYAYKHALALPLYDELTQLDQEYIVEELVSSLGIYQ